MSFIATFKIATRAISTNKARTVLTTLGIVIGISAVIALLSLGQGAQDFILQQVQGLGSNTITIYPMSLKIGSIGSFGSFSNTGTLQSLVNSTLDHRIVDLLANKITFNEITAVSPQMSKNYEVSYKSRTSTTSVYGIEEAYFEVTDRPMDKGRKITIQDNSNQRKVCVLGPKTATTLFGESDPIDQTIRINGINFTVVGVAVAKGTTDDRVYIPLSVASTELMGQKDYNQIVVQVSDDKLVDTVTVKIDNALRDFYKLTQNKDPKYTLLTSKDVLSITESITGIFTALLSSIAGISLVVGGIGIMNIMLVSVTERTKEIGLRKAVGAKRRAILSQFLTEAVVLTLTGGVIGIVLGLGMASVIGNLSGIPVQLSWQAIVLATSVSATIGIVFGFYPAYRAARLSPIDALRSE